MRACFDTKRTFFNIAIRQYVWVLVEIIAKDFRNKLLVKNDVTYKFRAKFRCLT
jgi:hypothetical protein